MAAIKQREAKTKRVSKAGAKARKARPAGGSPPVCGADAVISMFRKVIEKQAEVRRLMDEAHSVAYGLDGDDDILNRVCELCLTTSDWARDTSGHATSAIELLLGKRALRPTERRDFAPSALDVQLGKRLLREIHKIERLSNAARGRSA